jgi:hypothetical protein
MTVAAVVQHSLHAREHHKRLLVGGGAQTLYCCSIWTLVHGLKRSRLDTKASSQSGGIYNSYSTVALEITAIIVPRPRAK